MPHRTVFTIAAATILRMGCHHTPCRFAVAPTPQPFVLEVPGVLVALVSALPITVASIAVPSVAVPPMAHIAVTRPGVATGVGAAAAGAAAAGAAATGPYYNSACGSYPYPPCQ
jgi:hypothetical protein